MEIENQVSQWAKSTESRIEMFLDDYLIGSPISKVRLSSQRLILSLFNKGNNEQKEKIICLLEERCDKLICMGKAS
jgi:two-component SAPR family response regulator